MNSDKEARRAKQAQIEELLKARGAGQYLPPFKLRMLEEAVTDKSSPEYQRLTWDALKKVSMV
jgi:pre-mRNA-splicing factor CWC22